ncbi:hypothetical protein F5X96DRAFT_98263 [Biscogniauxia mediterranea]|nr:hypothetical protein F5X96DRAFT_98263 [Biscogniauxia mediterranea]
MSLAAPTPPLLLTKRLTAFLRSNLTPQIHTALLTTLSGKLLAHASPHSVSTLRTQCTVAASLWALYAASSTSAAVADALPPSSHGTGAGGSNSSGSGSGSGSAFTSSAITIQLTGAVVVIRRLRCGLLFVCIGPTADGSGGGGGAGDLAPSLTTRPLQAPGPAADTQPAPTPPLGSPSEAESVASLGGATTASIATTSSATASAVVAMRRQAEELARWLNDKLGSLSVPEEGLGGMEVR